jgi:hypothetical protein
MLVYPLFQALNDLIEYITADKRTKEIIRSVPYTCRTCELLGICRDESNGWKCRHGCLVMPEKPFVPYRCQECEKLKECRDENNNMKCRHGCLIINEEREKKNNGIY